MGQRIDHKCISFYLYNNKYLDRAHEIIVMDVASTEITQIVVKTSINISIV